MEVKEIVQYDYIYEMEELLKLLDIDSNKYEIAHIRKNYQNKIEITLKKVNNEE